VFEDLVYYEKTLKETFINPVGFFDNLSHVVMLANNIKEIASFNKDFDIFEDIKRIY
jgi:predicted nucleic acid-binding protein